MSKTRAFHVLHRPGRLGDVYVLATSPKQAEYAAAAHYADVQRLKDYSASRAPYKDRMDAATGVCVPATA